MTTEYNDFILRNLRDFLIDPDSMISKYIEYSKSAKVLGNSMFTRNKSANKLFLIDVANHFNLRVEQLYSRETKHKIVFPRQCITYCYKKFTKLSLAEVSDYISGFDDSNKFDHATIIHSVKTISNYLETNRLKSAEIMEVIKIWDAHFNNKKGEPDKPA